MVIVLLYIGWIILYIIGPNAFTGNIISVSEIIVGLWLIYFAYKNGQMGIFLIFIFMLSYYVETSRFFLFHKQIAFRSQVENPYTVYYVGMYIFLFQITLLAVLKLRKSSNNYSVIGKIHNQSAYWILISLSVLGTIFGKQGTSIFESGGYAESLQTMEVSTLYGYTIIPILLSMLYSDTKQKIRIGIGISAIYILKDIALGGRIDSIQLIFGLFCIYLQYAFRKKAIIILILIGFIFNAVWGVFRGLTTQNILAIANDHDIFSLSNGNSQEVYYASMRIIYMIQNGALSLMDRIEAACYFLLSMFIPYSDLPALANLSSYSTDVYGSGGGGLAPIFIYAMFGIPGVICLGCWVGRAFNKLQYKPRSLSIYFYYVLILATTPRWFAYYPIALIKFCLYGLIFSLLVSSIFPKLRNNHQHNHIN